MSYREVKLIFRTEEDKLVFEHFSHYVPRIGDIVYDEDYNETEYEVLAVKWRFLYDSVIIIVRKK